MINVGTLHGRPMWIDSHNHLQDPRLGNSAPLVTVMRAAGVEACVVNATSEEDWENVAQLAWAECGWVRPAFGIHPWRANLAEFGWLDRLKDRLLSNPLALVGECGLDQLIATPALKTQMPIFQAQLQLAREMERPITIHCVKAWEVLLDAFKVTPPPSRFLMHSFSGSIETAQRLIQMGAYFSFSGYFLHERKRTVLEIFRKLPLDRILLETDSPDMLPPSNFVIHPINSGLNHPANIVAIGEELAVRLRIPVDEFAKITRENTARCFGF